MKAILKYIMPPSGLVEMPFDAEIVSIQFQGDNLCIWAIVHPTNTPETRQFNIYATGEPLNKSSKPEEYLATVQYGSLVWHVFEIER